MNDNPISNPFDQDDKKSPISAIGNTSEIDAADSNRWMLIWVALGLLAICCGLIAAGALIYYKPNPQQLNDQYVNEAFDDRIKKGQNAIAVELTEGSQAVFKFDNLEVRTK